MARARRIATSLSLALAGALLAAVPAQAQYSPGYEFLKAVKDKDGAKVLELVHKPGSTLVNSRDLTDGNSALHIVVERRDVTWINFLLNEGANPNIRNKKGVTPLVLATRLGFIDGASRLIAKGAKVDIPDETGETPLIFAVHAHDIPMMRLLLRAGADPDRADSSGRTARDYAKLESKDGNLLDEIKANERPADQREGASNYGPSF